MTADSLAQLRRDAASLRHPLTRALLVLTFTAGLVDASTYLGLGHVFAANMTGNVVLLGFGIAGAGGLPVRRAARVARLFSARRGARRQARRRGWRLARIVASGSRSRSRRRCSSRRRCIAATVHPRAGHASADLVIGLLALGMGLRNAVVRALGIPDVTTTVLTMTLTGLAASSPWAGGDGRGSARRVAVVLAMLFGALAGALLLKTGITLVLAVGAALTIATLVGYRVLSAPGRSAPALGARRWRRYRALNELGDVFDHAVRQRGAEPQAVAARAVGDRIGNPGRDLRRQLAEQFGRDLGGGAHDLTLERPDHLEPSHVVGQMGVTGVLPRCQARVRARRVDDHRPLAHHRVVHLQWNLGRGQLGFRDLREVGDGDREPGGASQFAPPRLGGAVVLLALEAAEDEPATGMGEALVLDRVRHRYQQSLFADGRGEIRSPPSQTGEHRALARLVLTAGALDRRRQRQSLLAQAQHLEHRLGVTFRIAAVATG